MGDGGVDRAVGVLDELGGGEVLEGDSRLGADGCGVVGVERVGFGADDELVELAVLAEDDAATLGIIRGRLDFDAVGEEGAGELGEGVDLAGDGLEQVAELVGGALEDGVGVDLVAERVGRRNRACRLASGGRPARRAAGL